MRALGLVDWVISRSFVSSFHVSLGRERLHALFPQHAIVVKPGVHFCKRLVAKFVHAKLRVRSYLDEPGLSQHSQVTGHPGSCNG